jgi:hypothetical protein
MVLNHRGKKVMKMPQRSFWGMIFLAIFFSALVLSGCHRARRTPADETKKGTFETEPAEGKSSRTPGTEPASTGLVLDPVASGTILLNPAIPKDAEMIQTRLVELGLYKGAIDGIWGKGSRAGLKDFKEQHSLGNPEKWDKETQALLFSGTGQINQPPENASEESSWDGEVLLNPDMVKDARMIQKRLAELGLYKGQIDGIWGKGSRAALKTYKEQNSLGNPDRWDKDIQKLLFKK